MTNAEAAQARDLASQEASERAGRERNQSSKEREQAVKERNAERKQERIAATNALTSGSANIRLSEIARIGGPVGRKLEREIRNFQQTGRVSNWLAGETLKAEAAQNAAQQSAFRQAVTDVISTLSMAPIQIGRTNSYIPPLSKRPEIRDTAESAASSTSHPFKITSTQDPDNLNQYIITVAAGSINNVLASNWNEQEFINNNPTYVGLEINATANKIISSTLIFVNETIAGEATPVKWGTPSQFKILLGIVIETQVFQVVYNNLTYNAVKRITTDRTAPQAGLLPYDNWYTWAKISG